ncbi:hypothetical protein CTZ27_37120 [Streptomyces griseocarneus]|nr:hypothetical protein CTZ27_37120 [Streptomyces griseocarneus]
MSTDELNARQSMLLAVIEQQGGEWPTGRACSLYRSLGIAPNRATARGDLKLLARRGALCLCETGGRRYFALPSLRGGA